MLRAVIRRRVLLTTCYWAKWYLEDRARGERAEGENRIIASSALHHQLENQSQAGSMNREHWCE